MPGGAWAGAPDRLARPVLDRSGPVIPASLRASPGAGLPARSGTLRTVPGDAGVAILAATAVRDEGVTMGTEWVSQYIEASKYATAAASSTG